MEKVKKNLATPSFTSACRDDHIWLYKTSLCGINRKNLRTGNYGSFENSTCS